MTDRRMILQGWHHSAIAQYYEHLTGIKLGRDL